ncbi:MAG TPA: group 1 truncated hemoglobin [Vicinamibacterales bacterium]|nr:group 1 truncated hemoglobin [Vicinamibacterales bacterium]
MTESSLYERLGGAFAIAAVVDHFSDAIVQNPVVGQRSENPQLREWHTNNLGRLPGLKFMRTMWVCSVAGGPQRYAATKPGSTPLGLEEAHRELKISPAEFDEVAAELGRTLDFFKVPEREKEEVLAAFAAHKGEVTEGYSEQLLGPPLLTDRDRLEQRSGNQGVRRPGRSRPGGHAFLLVRLRFPCCQHLSLRERQGRRDLEPSRRLRPHRAIESPI